LAQVGLVVLPAHVENRPRILLKAIAYGIPVIASEACGLKNMAGVTTIPNGDVAALKDAIHHLLQGNCASSADHFAHRT
jgi:glycosyltransferase involved in cell wall biosynthesis